MSTKELTLEEARRMKDELDAKVTDLIAVFCGETGSYISDINIIHKDWTTIHGETVHDVQITTEVLL